MKYKCLIFNNVSSVSIRSPGANRIAHYLREQGWDAEVIEWAGIWSLDQLKSLAKLRITDDTKFIGVSATFSYVWSVTFEQFLVWVKQEYPHVKLIAGGQQELATDVPYIDYYIHGFAEHALTALLKYLYSNGTRPKFELLTSSGRKVINGNLTYPAFPMSDYMVKFEDRDFIVPGETLGIEVSRGCIFSCSYCNFPVLGVKGDYSQDAKNFNEQLVDTYNRFGVTNYIIGDETFNDRTEKITKFADVVETLPFTPWFTAFIRPDLLVSRDADREELLRMNVVNQYYGVESFNHPSAKCIGKGMDSDRLKSGLLDVKQYFNSHTDYYRGMMSFIVGLPHETVESVDSTRRWIQQNWNDQAFVAYTLWIPTGERDIKSKLSRDFKKYGYTEMQNPITTPNILIGDFPVRGIVNGIATDMKVSEMQWQNEHMNIQIASAIRDDWITDRESPDSTFKIGFDELCDPRLHSLSLAERYKLNSFNKANYVKSKFGFVDAYINKKLNYNG